MATPTKEMMEDPGFAERFKRAYDLYQRSSYMPHHGMNVSNVIVDDIDLNGELTMEELARIKRQLMTQNHQAQAAHNHWTPPFKTGADIIAGRGGAVPVTQQKLKDSPVYKEIMAMMEVKSSALREKARSYNMYDGMRVEFKRAADEMDRLMKAIKEKFEV